jgi:hypothetical protein
VRTLLNDCWAHAAADRLSFDEIFEGLEVIDFKVTRDVNCWGESARIGQCRAHTLAITAEPCKN